MNENIKQKTIPGVSFDPLTFCSQYLINNHIYHINKTLKIESCASQEASIIITRGKDMNNDEYYLCERP